MRPVKLNDPYHPVALDYAFFQHQKEHTQHLGTAHTPYYKPHTLVNNPPSPKDITLELLLASQAHIGHATSLWNPANARYIFGVRGRKNVGESPVHIISLEATAAHLRRACKVVTGVTERGGLVLFVGTREGQARTVARAAQLAKGYHLFTKWIPGSITNGQQILGRCAKKVVDEFDQEVEGFDDQLATTAALKPDLVVCLNPLENYVLLHECGLNSIPTIGIIDTDANPTWVTYPIPANDDSLRCVQVIAGVLGRAGEEGQANRQRLAKSGVILYPNTHGLTAPRDGAVHGKKRSSGQPRRKRQSLAPAAAKAAQPDLADDLDGLDVKRYEQDQRLLDEAEKQIGRPLHTGKAAVELSAAAEDTEYDVYQASSDDDNIDPSLINDSYSGSTVADEDYMEEDMNQFGGAEQLQTRPDAAAPPSPLEQVNDVQKELGEADASEGESTLEQVDEVVEELGEGPVPPQEPRVGNPDVSDAADPQHGAKT